VGLASGDFNGDGIPDFVIGNANGGTNTTGITVFIANADGSLQTGVNYFPAGTKFSLQYVTVGDFNGDGKLDIAASDTYNGVIQIFYGNGDSMGTFTTGPTYPSDSAASPHPVGIVTADFNGDGKPDLAFVNNTGPENAPTGSDVGILINNGAGGFNTVANYPITNAGKVATELTAASLRGNGTLDVVVPVYGQCSAGSCNPQGTAVAIFLGKGDGTLQAESDFQLVNGSTAYFNPYHAAVGDLNGDGKADLAVTIQNVKGVNQGIAVALGNGDGTFQTPTLLPSSPQNPLFVPPPVPGYVKIADLNRDGHMDLVYTNAVAGSVGVMYGVGDGTFYTPVDFPANRWAWDFALVDVNGDGALDVVASGFEQSFSGVGVLLNTSGSSTALKSSLPHSVAGQSVTFTATITGSPVKGVTTTPTGTITFFNGTTQLGAPVPISSGTASLSTTALPVGTDSITAQYSGDTNYVPTTSAALPQVVGQATSSTATPTSSVNPSALGQAVTFSTTVTSTVSGDSLVPTGTVNFNDGATLLGPGTLNSSGVAAFTTSKLAAGTHSITAVYAGDTNFTGSTSGALSQVVSSTALPASYTLTATPTTQTVSAGSSATYSIKVNPTNYTGTVTFACPTTLPTGVTCTPPGPSAPPYAAGTLTLKTTAATTAMMAPPANQRHSDPTLWASLMGVGMLGMVLAGDWKKRNRRALGIVLLVVALAMIMALAGCGGGSSSGGGGGGGGGNGGTPAGSYPITINATGTGITTPPQPQQLTVTLVVN
jgi:Bacterial Ig-like domain (group 3)/FG-GAP-like repeat/FG-GAP repeat